MQASSGPPAWTDPMLEKFAASFVASPPTGTCSTVPEGASQEVDTSLVDTRSPVKTAQWMTDSPSPSHVQGPPQVTLSPMGQPGIMDVLVRAATSEGATIVAATDVVNNTPSPQTDSADCRLKSFIERLTKARQPPLLELPGDDSSTDRRPPPTLPKRSRRIAAQSLSHIPVAKARRAPCLEAPGTKQRDVDSVHVGQEGVRRNLRRRPRSYGGAS
jgi:hypothetical protein